MTRRMLGTRTPAARHALWIVAIAPLLAQMAGSAFNIWYNLVHIEPMMTPVQLKVFLDAVHDFNLVAYPLPAIVWLGIVATLHRPLRELEENPHLPADRLVAVRRRVINLPMWSIVVAGTGWLACIPFLLWALQSSPEPIAAPVFFHLAISILISGLIAVTHGCFVVELLSQRFLYPLLFRGTEPTEISGTHPMSLQNRSVLWAACVVVCPLVALVLLILAPHPETPRNQSFALTVASLGVLYGTSSAWLIGFFVVRPVQVLRAAAERVADGELEVEIDLTRADEFGSLVHAFKRMIGGLRERERVLQVFGRHVGAKTAREILSRDPGLGGVEKEITVVFADLRNFTSRCSRCTPAEGVALLNRFFTEAVGVIEANGGIVNKFLGDGLMAVFGAAEPQPDHAQRAFHAGTQLLKSIGDLNESAGQTIEPALQLGVGIHTGPAIVGSIGAPQRMEYTAIGDTVNVASRVESLTKELGRSLLITEATFQQLTAPNSMEALPPAVIRGKADAVTLYAVRRSPLAFI